MYPAYTVYATYMSLRWVGTLHNTWVDLCRLMLLLDAGPEAVDRMVGDPYHAAIVLKPVARIRYLPTHGYFAGLGF